MFGLTPDVRFKANGWQDVADLGSTGNNVCKDFDTETTACH